MKRTIVLRTICALLSATAMSATTAQAGSISTNPRVTSASSATVAHSSSKGALVTVKGVAGKLRLPIAAGRIAKVAPTGPLVPSAPTTTFLAHGSKSISLCYLNKAARVTCTPVGHTSMLEGIAVSYFHKDGYNLIFFRPMLPASKSSAVKPQTQASVAFTARAFMTGLNKAAVVLEHHAARHKSDLPMPSVIDADGSGGGCSYDDWGDLTCDGGGDGGGGGSSDPVGDMGCDDCSYPGDSDPAQQPDPVQAPDQGSVPATNAGEPCGVVDGTTVCEMTGPRPLPVPAAPPAGTIPPVGGIPPIEQLPRGQTPWFPQSWCDWDHFFCSGGQEPRDNDRGPNSDTGGKTRDELDEICNNINKVEVDMCKVNYPPSSKYREYLACKEKADQRMFDCFRTANQLTDYGAHPAP